jgi:hypothetical protein
VNRNQLQENPLVNRPLYHLECDRETGAIYAKPVKEASDEHLSGSNPEHEEEADDEASNQ